MLVLNVLQFNFTMGSCGSKVKSHQIFAGKFRQAKQELFEYEVYTGRKPTRNFHQNKCFHLDHQILNSLPIQKLSPNSFIIEEENLKDKPFLNETLIDNIPDSRKQIQTSSAYPHCCIGLVTGKFGTQFYHGTGCIIHPKIILTCAHNLYSRSDKKEPIDLKFIPGANGKQGRSFQVKKFFYPEEYGRLNEGLASKYDFGLLILEEDLTDEYGYLGFDTRENNISEEEQVEVCGYPGDKPFSTMWSAFGSFVSVNEDFLFHQIPTEVGQSGCPIVKRVKNGNNFVVGIHIGSISSKKKNVALRLTRDKRKKINEWVGEVTGSLNFCKQGLGDEEMKIIGEEKWSKKLTDLNLEENKISWRGVCFLSYGKCENLRTLSLGGNKIGDKGIQFLKSFSQLKFLSLFDNQITENGIHILSKANFSYLQSLNLSDNPIKDNAIRSLHFFKFLTKLSLRNTSITKKGMQFLSEGNFPYLQELSVSDNHLGDEGIPFLKKFVQIEKIDLWNVKLTVKGVIVLWQMQLPSLKRLGLWKNRIGEQGRLITEKMRKEKGIDVEYWSSSEY